MHAWCKKQIKHHDSCYTKLRFLFDFYWFVNFPHAV